jgi:hypothetical protein
MINPSVLIVASVRVTLTPKLVTGNCKWIVD